MADQGNQDGLDIYTKHMSTAGVDEEPQRISAVHNQRVSHDREWAKNDGQGQSDVEKAHDGGTEGRICNKRISAFSLSRNWRRVIDFRIPRKRSSQISGNKSHVLKMKGRCTETQPKKIFFLGFHISVQLG